MRRYFVADLHLDDKRPDILRAFALFLQQPAPGDELYLLGDIFEAWIGDDAVPTWLQPLLEQLAALSGAGVHLYFQHGNRDFLVGASLAARIGAQLLPEIHAIDSVHGRTLLLHGDQLCSEDHDYQAFRALVRSPQWQQDFLAKPVEERLAIARQLRAASREQGMQKASRITDVTPATVAELMRSQQAALMIHGHTHRPRIHRAQDDQPADRIVLGDWDREGWYLEQDQHGSRLYAFPLPVTTRLTAVLRDSLAAPR